MAKKINWKELRKAYEIQDQREKENVAQQKRDEFNSFLTESEDYLQKERKAYDSADFNTFSGANNAFRSGVESWRGRSNAARSYVSSLKGTVAEEEYKSYLDVLNRFDAELRNLADQYESRGNYYSGFANAEEEKKFAETMNIDLESEMEALRRMREDFKAFETDPNKFNQPSALYQLDLGKRKSAIADQEKKIAEARDLQYSSKYAGFHPTEIDKILSQTNLQGENRPSDDELKWLIDNRDLFEENLTDAEKDKKYALARLYADQVALSKGEFSPEYASATKWLSEYEAQKRQERAEYMAENHPVLGSIETAVTSPLNMVGLFEDIGRNIRGVEIDPNSRTHMFQQSNEAIREEISKDLSGFGSFIYNTGMSIADTVVRLPLGSAGLLVAGGGAAASQIADAKKRGASDEQAIASGLASGIAEALFENLSLKGLTELKNTGGAGFKNFVKSIAKQMWTEGNEELLTEVANAVTDSIINQDLSALSLNYQNYISQGLSEGDAFGKTALDFGKQVGEAWLGGVLSGGVFGLGGTTVGAVNNYTVGRDLIKGKQVKQTADLASTFDADSLTAKRLAEMQKKTAKTGKESASYAGALYQAMAQESFEKLSEAKRSNIETSVREKLAEKGLNTDEKTVRAVAKKIFGKIYGAEKLTTSENKITSREEYSKAVDELASDAELFTAFSESESIKEAEGTVAKLEEIAAKSEANGEIAKIVDRMKVSADGADLKNVTVENNGDVYITDAEGKKTLASDVELTEEAATAVAYTDGMSPAKKRAFLSQYAESGNGIPLDDFHLAFDYAYTKGLSGAGVDEAVEYAGPTLTDGGAFAAFKKGLDVRGEIKAEKDAEIKSFQKTLGIKREGGKVDDKAIRYAELNPSDPRRAVVSFVKVVAQTTGRNFVFFHSTAAEQESGKENGRYEPETNTIYIDINAGINETQRILVDQVLPTVSHELVHIFAVEDPEGFKALSDLVFAGLKESTGHTRSYLISEEINRILEKDPNRFEGKNEETRRAIAEEEIVARACEDRLANSRLMKKFIEEMENKESGLAQKFSNFLGEAIARLKKIFQQIAAKLSYSKEAQSLRKLTDRLEAIQSQYDALLERRTMEATAAPSEQQKNTSDRGVMLMSRKESESIKKQILGAIDQLAQMDVVASVTTDGFGNLKNDKIATIISKEFSKFGSKIDRKNFGVVLVEYQQINKALNYLDDPAEKAALYTVPRVIKRGIVIDSHIQHKERGVDSITFGAPVEINGVRGNVGVVVQTESRTNRFKTLRILLPNGKAFELVKIKEAEFETGGSPKELTSGGTPIESASGGIITNPSKSVNPQNSEEAKGEMKSERMVVSPEHKQQQLEIINATNPAWSDSYTWIRKVEDIHSLEETIELSDWKEYDEYDPDLTRGDIENAIQTGKITVYSSHPIQNGAFVTPSLMEAETYAGDGKIYKKTVNIADVAWIDPTQGQYAKVDSKGTMKSDRGTMKAERDSGGNVLSEGQKEYFIDSKVRDENGNLLIMYHGTPNAVFTKFKPGTYFTQHKWYADVYQSPGASSLGYKRTAEKPDTYEVYLNIKKPFDTRNKTERDIFYNEFYGKWGTGTDLMESGLPDWMDGIDLLEFLEEMGYDYDGLILDEGGVGGYGDEVKSRGLSYVVMDASQVKKIDNKNPTSDPDIRYADRAKYMTARELLLQAMADEEIKKSEIYSPLLREYANRVTELDKKYMALEAAEHDYVASIDAFDSEEKQARYQYNMDNLAREILRIERDLTKQEESPELKRLVLREKAATRRQTEKEARQDTASRMSNLRKSIERKSTLERIEAKTKLLSKKLTENTRKSHIPDDLKQPLDKFLGSIKGSIRDLQYGYGTPAEVEFQEATPASEQSTFVKDIKNALKELRAAIKENSQIPIVQAEKQSTDTTEGSQGAAYSGILMIDPHILDKMEALASYLEKLTDDGITYELAELDLDQAKSLDEILTSVSRIINSIDRAFAGQGKEKISDLGESSMAYMKPIIDESKKKGSSKLAKFLKDATTWEEMTPYTAFSQFGEGGRTIYGNILRGWGDYAFYAKQILDFAEKTWTPEEAKEWSETVKTYKLADQEFEATTAQMMYLYLLSKREQGKLHLNGDGFVIGDYTITKAGVKKTVEAKKVSAIKSTEKQRDAFFDRYLPKGSREREVAETMQRFLADTSGAWGNELSYKLYGYRAFTDLNYVPIVVDPTKLSASAGDFEGGLYRLMNMGFTKPLNPKANNSVFAVDLFEVFATHAADMAKYRSLALPVMDAIRWMNYSPVFELEDGSVERDPNNLQSVMGAAYGTSAFNYVKQFIMDLNGSNGDKVNSMEALAASLTRAYKTAAVGANLKVVALQPTSYLRALAVLDRSSLVKAFSYMESEDEKGKADGKKAKKAFDQATQNSGMALWKSLGYYDVGIGRTLTDQIKQYEYLYDKTLDLSMKLAAKADEMTLGVLFKACQIEIIDSGKAAGLSREELLKAAGELLDEVIVRTQVVDSTVTRSQLMRSKSKFTKNLTAFMSEPTVAYNLILQGVFDMQHDLRRGMSFKQALQNNRRTLKKNFAAYAATALAAAAVETLFAALRRREDEDEEEFLDGILNGILENSKTFGGKILENANPITMIPMIGDLFEKAWNTFTGKQNYSDNMEYEGIQSVWETVDSIAKLFEEGGFTVEKLFSTIDDGTKAASYLTGLPIANAIRDVKAIWNSTIGDWTNLTWDMQTPSASSALEKAFKKGELRDTVDGMINQKYLELQEERPNVSPSELRDRAKTSVKTTATAFFKKRYLDALKKGDRKKMDEIRSAMRQTGLYDHANQTAFEWEEVYREDRREKGLD